MRTRSGARRTGALLGLLVLLSGSLAACAPSAYLSAAEAEATLAPLQTRSAAQVALAAASTRLAPSPTAITAQQVTPTVPDPAQPTQSAGGDEPEPTVQTPLPTLVAQNPTPATPPEGLAGGGSDMFLYQTQSGDTLAALALRFGVDPGSISSSVALPGEGLLPAGLTVFIPDVLSNLTPSNPLLPDSEIVDSPSAADFDAASFAQQAGGYLSGYQAPMGSGTQPAVTVLLQEVRNNSANPRLLMGLLEFQNHLVTGQPAGQSALDYPMGYANPHYRGFFLQLSWAVQELFTGYYGWRSGQLTELQFRDGTRLRLAPMLNAGTVAIQYLFAQMYDQKTWLSVLYGENNFPAAYARLMGDPWLRASSMGPLFPPGLAQPALSLPYPVFESWSFSGGPHPAWGPTSPFAALDFAPGSVQAGCVPSNAWVRAMAPGLVVRSGDGQVVVDLDGDGREETGWDVFYLHIATAARVPVGLWLNQDDLVGHPSCEGGNATGTHVHVARKYNGEWIPADGPLPFVLSGWQAHSSGAAYKGWVERQGVEVQASPFGNEESRVLRYPDSQ